jgi:hypothetical protein
MSCNHHNRHNRHSDSDRTRNSTRQKVTEVTAQVKDLVEPCFPPAYRIFELFVDRYHALLVELVADLMSRHASSLSAKDIIDIVSWLRDYHGQVRQKSPV